MTIPITVRFPTSLHARVREAAHGSDRSLSAEIVNRVRRSFAAADIEGGPRGARQDAGAALPDQVRPRDEH